MTLVLMFSKQKKETLQVIWIYGQAVKTSSYKCAFFYSPLLLSTHLKLLLYHHGPTKKNQLNCLVLKIISTFSWPKSPGVQTCLCFVRL